MDFHRSAISLPNLCMGEGIKKTCEEKKNIGFGLTHGISRRHHHYPPPHPLT
jgi:hypothetical protein